MKKNGKLYCNYMVMVLYPIILFYLFEFYTHNPFSTMYIRIQILNIVFFELLTLFLFFLFGRLKAALLTETILFGIIGLANYFVIQFRSAPIMPWDLFSIKTAASVANNYSYKLETSTIIVLVLFILLAISECFISLRYQHSFKKPRRILPIAALLLLLCGYVWFLHQDSTITRFKIYDKLFTPTVMTKKDGTAVAFLIELKYMSVSKPNGYSVGKAEELLASYENTQEIVQKPNIIVIMDEAFSDPAILGDFETNEDYMPFVHSLMEGADNTQSGYMDVSILGGNTPNTEFEYLTGNTLAFLPQGSIPFQQYVKEETPSLASYLKEIGYQTIAMHPYNSGGWDRDTTYPLLGFEEMYFLPDFKNADYVRKYVSDQSCFDKIIDFYEKKEKDTPLFLFNVTMQNHSSYTDAFDNFTPSIAVTEGEPTALNNYLSLLKLTDTAFENLITYFSTQEEPTIIVFFGDHQPTNSVVSPIYRLNGDSVNDLTDEEEYLRYQVPFIIWANYDINSNMTAQSGLHTSANYLGLHTLQTAGLPLPPYLAYLAEEESRFKTISALHVTDTAGNDYSVKEQKDALNTYACLQYYQLFASKER